MMQKSVTDYSEHCALLLDHLTEVHGPLTAKIAERLMAVGSATLKDLADHIRTKEPFGDEATSAYTGSGSGTGGVLHTPQIPVGSATHLRSASDKEIKFALATLMQHAIVAHDPVDKTYTVLVGQGLLQFLLPSFVRFVRSQHGDAGDVVISMLARYSKLTLGAIEREVLRSAPVAASEVKLALERMCRDGWIVSCGSRGSTVDSQPAEKKLRTEDDSTNSVSLNSNSPYEISYAALLQSMRAKAIQTYSKERFDPFGASIINAMVNSDTSALKQRGSEDTFTSAASGLASWLGGGEAIPSSTSKSKAPAGFEGVPQLPALSSALSSTDLYDEVEKFRRNNGTSSDAPSNAKWSAKLTSLCYDEFGGMLQESQASSSHGAGGAGQKYCVNYRRVVSAMQDRLVEKTIFSRYGVVGTRVLNLLLRGQAYEERHIAEECICTLAQVRESLLGMLQDGYVRQIEIPKSKVDYNQERNPKNSSFVWIVNKDNVVMHTRRQLIKSLRNTRIRLLFEFKRLEELFPAIYAKGVHWLLNGGGLVGAANATASPQASISSPTDAAGLSISSISNKGSLTHGDHETLLKLRFACRALSTTQAAQMELILLMDYY